MKRVYLPLAAATLAAGLFASGSALAAGVVTAPAPAAMSGVYASVFGGYALGTTVNGTIPFVATTANLAVPLNGGYSLGGAVGMHFLPNLRGDIELDYASRAATGTLSATVSGVAITPAPTDSGSIATAYLLADIWYDIDTGTSFTPYIGAGVGVADIMPNLTFPGGGFKTAAWAPAAQLGAGVKFDVADGVALDLGYRIKGVANGTLVSTPSGTNMSGVSYLDQSVQLGLQFNF